MDNTQERKQDNLSDNINAVDSSEFRSKKHIQGAISWGICIILTLFCYYETKINAMMMLVPILVLLAGGFLREAKNSAVRFDNGKLIIRDYAAFMRINREVDIKDISAMILDISCEGKTETIHSITLVAKNANIVLPDVDNKEGLKEKLVDINPSVKIKKV
ncbi:MAG: hypothetical protein LWY06_01565 [Firmicutes bacterium]|nr:hypothetical protein [Bacillota bacterium]